MNCVLHINLLRELMAFHLMTRKCSAIARYYLRPLHITHKTAKIFVKKVGEKLVAHIRNCEKNLCSGEKKLLCVRRITAFFAVLFVVCEGL